MSASSSAPPAGAGALSNAYSLMQGAPSLLELLKRQRVNLDTFLRDNTAAFAALPYEPWTTPPAQPAPGATLRTSSLAPDHLGVYPTQALSGGQLAAYYPGLLMSSELLNEFNQHYYCPTALDIPTLDYTDERTGKAVKIVIIGDPSAPGPNLLDAGTHSNCTIDLAVQSWHHIKRSPGQKIAVRSSLLQLRVKQGVNLRPADELFFSYETAVQRTFWNALSTEEHCAICFRREHLEPDNPLIQCEGNNGTCPVSRHRNCMSPVPSMLSIGSARFFCPLHLEALRLLAAVGSTQQPAMQPLPTSPAPQSPPWFRYQPPPPRPSPDFLFPCFQVHPSLKPATLATRLESASDAASPPPRAHLSRAAAATSSSSSKCRPPKHNLPVIGAAVPQGVVAQIYDPSDAVRSLERNCASLSTERIPSTLGKQAGHGLAIKRDTVGDAIVGYMWGHCITRDTWSILRAGGPEAISLCDGNPELLQHVEWAQSGVWWCLELQALCDAEDEYLLLVSPQCPMGWINDPQAQARANVVVREPLTCVQSADGRLDYWLFPLHSTRPLVRDEELFLDYGWTPKEWKRSMHAAKLAAAKKRAEEMSDAESSEAPCESSDSAYESEDGDSKRPGRTFGSLGNMRQLAAPLDDDDNSQCHVALPVRKKRAIEKLPCWKENIAQFGPIGGPLRELIIAAVEVHRGAWFAPPLQKAGKEAASVISASQVSTNGQEVWCKVEQIGRDFAEYKSCCGAQEILCTHLAKLAPAQMKAHSSLSIINMVKARVKLRSAVESKDQFSSWVQSQLEGSVQGRVPWQGDTVCCSCFRALIGVSRATLHSWRCKVDKKLQEALQMHPSGQIRRPKPASKLDEATAAVTHYVSQVGQSIPNSRSNNVNEELMVVPARDQTQLLSDVLHFTARASQPGQEPPTFARSTLRRALKSIRETSGVRVSAVKSKMICRCDDCETLDRALDAVPLTERARRLLITSQKQRHLLEVMQQRQHFDNLKARALASPLDVWVLAFDGMDQAKTQLPSFPRLAKSVDSLPRLGVHAVGAFTFGGPVPVMGLLNYEDLRKDSSLSVTTVMSVLERQWQALMKQVSPERDQPASDSGAGSTSDGDSEEDEPMEAAKDPNAMDEGDDDPSEGRRARKRRRAARVVTPAMLQHAASQWPERLHLTFDNAVGEAKNQYMFRFLGLLVLFNIFHTVTVSTLLVGHTHDIVDQMFSVWARILRVNDATTYEAMRALFRDKYHSKIKGLVALMRGGKRGEPEVEEAVAALGPEAVSDILEARDVGDDDIVIDQAVATEFEKFAADLKLDQGVKPVITLQTFNVNIRAWLARAKGGPKLGCKKGADEQPLEHVAVPHIFGIEKDDAGDVWLYNKFLAQSEKVKGDGVTHSFLKQKTGSYTTRVLLHKASNAAYFNFDPDIWPARPLDEEVLRKTFDSFESSRIISARDKARLLRVLTMFRRRQKKQSVGCKQCAALIQQVHAVGVVSRKPGSSEMEKAAATAKSKTRTDAQKALEHHLTEAHEALHKKTTGWFTNWSNIRAPLIAASYVQRGIILARELQDVPYHIHPRRLCEGKGEQPVFESHGRADVRCLTLRGPPERGQLIVVRADDPNEVFWIGRIIELNPTAALERCPPLPLSPNFWGGENENELGMLYARETASHWKGKGRPFEIRMSHVVPTEIGQPTQLGAFFSRQVAPREFLDLYSDCMVNRTDVQAAEDHHIRRVANVHHKVLDGSAFARCFTRYIAHNEAGLAQMRALPASAFLPTPEEMGELQYSRFLLMAAGCMINSPKHSGEHANVVTVAMDLGACVSHSRVSKLQSTRAGQKGEELLGWYHSEEERSIAKPQDVVGSGGGAAAAAASSSSATEHAADFPSRTFGRAHVSDRHAIVMDVEGLPSVTVTWLDINPDDYIDLKLGDASHWAKEHAKHAAPSSSSDRVTRPDWQVSLFAATRYSESYKAKLDKRARVVTTLAPASFIFWGEPEFILTKENKLREDVWRLVREDLTECTRNKSAASKANRKPRARSKKVSDEDSEAEPDAQSARQDPQRRLPSSRAAAASAAAANLAAAAQTSESEPTASDSDNDSDEPDHPENEPLSHFVQRKRPRSSNSEEEAEVADSPAPAPSRRRTRAASKAPASKATTTKRKGGKKTR